MANKTLPNLNTITASLATYIAVSNSDGVLGKATLDAVKALIAVTSSLTVETAVPATNPGAVEGGRMWVASTAGTYTNFGGIVIGASEAAFLVDTGAAYEKVTIPVSLAGYITTASVVDNLLSTSATVPLSANQGRILAASSVSVEKKVVSVSKNILDESAIVVGYVTGGGTLDTGGGTTVGWKRTAYTPVLPSTTYTFHAGTFTPSSVKYIAAYTSAHVFISQVGPANANPKTFTTPSNAAYIVMNLKEIANAEPAQLQIELGSVFTSYEPHIPDIIGVLKAAGDVITASALEDTTMNAEYVQDKIADNVTMIDVISSTNILDPSLFVINSYVNSAGVITTGSGWMRTGKIPLTAAATYTFSAGVFNYSTAKQIAYFTAADVFISRAVMNTPLPYTFTAPANTAYAYIVIQQPGDPTPEDLQVEVGSTATPYDPYSVTVVSEIMGVPLAGSATVAPVTAPTTALFNMYPHVYVNMPNFRKKYAGAATATADNHVKILMEGDSIFAREMYTTVGGVVPSAYPPMMVTDTIGARLFRSMKSLERPVYARYDAVGAFTETGTWTTNTSNWDDSATRPSGTRITVSSAATLVFTIEAIYNRFNFVDRTDLTGSTGVVISVAGGAGKMEVMLPGTIVWVEANGAVLSQLETAGTRRGNSVFARRVQFRKVGSGVSTSIAVTLTKPANATTFLYWGVEKMGGAKPYVSLINIARGSNTLSMLTNVMQNDLVERKPDLVLFEIPLVNMYANTPTPTYCANWVQDFLYGDRVGFTNVWNLKTVSNNWADFEVLCVLPHFIQSYFDSSGNPIVGSGGFTCREVWGSVKSLLYEKGDLSFIDMAAAFEREAAVSFLGNYYNATAASTSVGNTFMADGLHPNNKGTAIYEKHLCPIFDINTL